MAARKQSEQENLAPLVLLSNRHDKAILADYIRALEVMQGGPYIFRQDTALSELRFKPSGAAYLRIMDKDAALYLLEHASTTAHKTTKTFVSLKTDKKTKKTYITPASVPARFAGMLQQAKHHFPPIQSVSRVPVLRQDGTFVTTPGYDADSQVYYDPAANFCLPSIPDTPTAAEAAEAAALLIDVLSGFPFADTSDRANALGLLLTFVMRQAINGPVPMASVDALSGEGTGKTLLAETLLSIALGKPQHPHTMPEDDTEMVKTLLSMAAEGGTLVFFDNVKSMVSSAALEAAISTQGINNRLLSKNIMLSLPLVATWVLTTNGAHFSKDMNRRTYPIRLDARISQAFSRTSFKYELPDYAIAQQGKLLAACMIMVRAWYTAGCPDGTVNPILSGAFPKFVKMIGGCLEYAGITGFLDNVAENMARQNDEGLQWSDHLSAIYDHYQDAWFTTQDLMILYGESDDYKGLANAAIADTIPTALVNSLDKTRTFRAKATTVGTFLKNRNLRMWGPEGLMLEQAPRDRSNRTRYRVVKGNPLPPSEDTPTPVTLPGAACPFCRITETHYSTKEIGKETFFVCPSCHHVFREF